MHRNPEKQVCLFFFFSYKTHFNPLTQYFLPFKDLSDFQTQSRARLRRQLQKMARGSGSDLVADPGWGEMGKHPLGLALIWSCGVPAPFLVSGHHVTRVTKHSLLRKAFLLQQQTCSPAQPSAAQRSPAQPRVWDGWRQVERSRGGQGTRSTWGREEGLTEVPTTPSLRQHYN